VLDEVVTTVKPLTAIAERIPWADSRALVKASSTALPGPGHRPLIPTIDEAAAAYAALVAAEREQPSRSGRCCT